MGKPTSLYRFFDESERLLYVGVTSVPRWDGGHRRDKPWWTQVHKATVEHFDERTVALTAERYAIKTEGPEHNVVHNNGNGTTETTSTAPKSGHPLREGDVVAVGINGSDLAPVGMVISTDDLGFRMTMVDWISGFFSGADRWYPWRLVDVVVFADLMHPDDVAADGWNPDVVKKVYDLDPLSRFQTEWEKHVEKGSRAE